MNRIEFWTKTPTQVVEGYLKAWNNHDLGALLATLDESVVVVVPSFAEPIRGKQQLRTLWGTLFDKVSPDVKEQVLTTMVEDHTVACECIETAVYAPDSIDKPYRIHLAVFFRVNARGLISEIHSYWDTTSMFQQLGKGIAEIRGVLS